jgi:hypothetical protein
MSTPLRERPDAPLGTLIFRAGLLPAETIENALEEGVKTGRRLGEILIERGLIKEEDLTRLLAGQKGLPFVSLREQTIEPEAARLLAEEQARLYTALPISFEDGTPVVAVADPTNDVLNRNIREAIGQEARFVVAARSELNDVIGEVFSGAFQPAAAPASDPEPEPEVEPEPEPELPPLRVDTSAPAADVEPAAPTPKPQAASEPEPAEIAEPGLDEEQEPEPEPAPAFEASESFDASEYDFNAPASTTESAPEPEPAPDPEPSYEAPAPEPEPAPAASAAPAEPPEQPAEPPEQPAPLVAPLATEPVAPQGIPQTNGQVPEAFEDDSPPQGPGSGGGYRVSIRLTSGERMTVAECEEIGEAKGYAKALTKQLGATDSDDWPFVNGRFLKPDTILSVDVEEI